MSNVDPFVGDRREGGYDGLASRAIEFPGRPAACRTCRSPPHAPTYGGPVGAPPSSACLTRRCWDAGVRTVSIPATLVAADVFGHSCWEKQHRVQRIGQSVTVSRPVPLLVSYVIRPSPGDHPRPRRLVSGRSRAGSVSMLVVGPGAARVGAHGLASNLPASPTPSPTRWRRAGAGGRIGVRWQRSRGEAIADHHPCSLALLIPITAIKPGAQNRPQLQ